MNQQPFMSLPGISPAEVGFLQQAMNELSEDQQKNFFMVYTGKRRNPQDLLLLTLLGFVGVAGVQRFIVGQVGMGLLYLFTAGLCWIGTIMDIVNYRTIALDYNQQMAYESFQMIKMGGQF
jgi:TM2 domain-containing membrane protein YozV